MIPIPTYPLYTACLTLMGGAGCFYHLDEDKNWSLTVAILPHSILSLTLSLVGDFSVVLFPCGMELCGSRSRNSSFAWRRDVGKGRMSVPWSLSTQETLPVMSSATKTCKRWEFLFFYMHITCARKRVLSLVGVCAEISTPILPARHVCHLRLRCFCLEWSICMTLSLLAVFLSPAGLDWAPDYSFLCP